MLPHVLAQRLAHVVALAEGAVLVAALRKAFAGAEDPDRRYLRHFCTAMLGMMSVNPGMQDYAARQARAIPCDRWLRRRFPLIAPEDREED